MAFWNRKKKEDSAPLEEKPATEDETETPEEKTEAAPSEDASPEQPNADATDNEPKPSILKRLLKAVLLLVLVVALIIAAFCGGIYMRIIDGDAASEQLKKHDVPILGEYLAKIPLMPEKKDEVGRVDGEEKPADSNENKTADKDKDKTADKDKNADKDKDKDKNKQQPKKIKLTKEEIEKQTKEREAAEKKRVSKLARLYTNMKAKEAADALVNLDDNMIIAILQRMEEGQAAKILAQFDPERTAQITRIMFVGAQQRVTVPADLTENGESYTAEQ